MQKFGKMLLLLIFSSSTQATEVATNVSDVTVYTNSAMVTRSAQLSLNKGEQKIELTGFPSNVETQNLRIEVNKKHVRLGQVTVKDIEFLEAQDPEVIALNQKILLKNNEIRTVSDSTKAAQLQLKFLDSLADGYSKEAWIGSSQGNADTNSWQRALSLMQSGSEKSFAVIRKNILNMDTLKQELSLLNRQLANKRNQQNSSKSVIVYLESADTTKADIKVHYLQEYAGWEPVYEARLDSASGKLELSQKAVISQQTEEPWLNTKVTLSSSQPSEEMTATRLASQFYDLTKIQPYKYSKKKVQSSRFNDNALEEVVVTGVRKSNAWSGNYSLNFPIAGRINVSNNDDQSQRYDLKKFEFDTDLITQINPREEKRAFLNARFTNDGENPIYGSDMLVYVDGVLMGSASMPNILPGSEVTLPMGVDRRIEVIVKDLAGQGGDSGIIKKQKTIVEDLVFEIINRRNSSAKIEVRAVYPVSKNKALKVTIDDKATPADDFNDGDTTGVALWSKRVNAGDTWSINFAYSMKHPTDMTLQRRY